MYPITVYIGIFDLKFMLFGRRGTFGVLRGFRTIPELLKSRTDNLAGMLDFVENQGAKPTAVFVASWGH